MRYLHIVSAELEKCLKTWIGCLYTDYNGSESEYLPSKIVSILSYVLAKELADFDMPDSFVDQICEDIKIVSKNIKKSRKDKSPIKFVIENVNMELGICPPT